MANKKKGHLTTTIEWAKHLRKDMKNQFWRGERNAAKKLIQEESNNEDFMKSPILKSGRCSVLIAELQTGHLLTITSDVYIGHGEIFQEFRNEEIAKSFCLDRINDNPEIECIIYDENGKASFYLNTNEIKDLRNLQ